MTDKISKGDTVQVKWDSHYLAGVNLKVVGMHDGWIEVKALEDGKDGVVMGFTASLLDTSVRLAPPSDIMRRMRETIAQITELTNKLEVLMEELDREEERRNG